jgi:hypothetical protein
MSVSCGIFVQFFKCKVLMSGKFVSFIASYTLCMAVGAEGGIKRWVRNNRNDNDFEYLRIWLIFVVTVGKINSLTGNFLTKMKLFCFK